ncbi:hypothetical protein [Amycolatopsis sp. WAC 04197]|uniref:hypothetical protein n=1 Tax=Amycolatopsis sp. WAC 04197 TaxID=2203199 RepID=UPI000F7B8CCB|nr:hypothetical protein [Amycolatopsis sp. WAC 04197]
MSLGTGEGPTEKHLRRRLGYRVAAVVSLIPVSGGAIGLAVQAFGKDPIWGFEGFFDEIALICVGLLVALFARDRARVHAGLAEAAPDDRRVDDAALVAIDPERETAKLRLLGLRSAWIALIWPAVLTTGILLLVLGGSGEDGFGKLGVLPTAFGLVGFVGSLMSAAGWRARHRAVQSTGWRPARATVRPDYEGLGNRLPPATYLTFDDGTETVVRSVGWSIRSCRRFRKNPGLRVRVGGEGANMVVLFPRGRISRRPYAFPAQPELVRSPSAHGCPEARRDSLSGKPALLD